MKRILSQYHAHIDNGGISVLVNQDLEEKTVTVEFNTQYFGYPSVSSSLTILEGNIDTAEYLQGLADTLQKAAKKYKQSKE